MATSTGQASSLSLSLPLLPFPSLTSPPGRGRQVASYSRQGFSLSLFPTNVASVHLVTGCPNARAGAKTGEEEEDSLENLLDGATQLCISRQLINL